MSKGTRQVIAACLLKEKEHLAVVLESDPIKGSVVGFIEIFTISERPAKSGLLASFIRQQNFDRVMMLAPMQYEIFLTDISILFKNPSFHEQMGVNHESDFFKSTC